MGEKIAQYEQEHTAVVRRMAPECMVLLKTDGHLPLTNLGDLALYGNGARHTHKGGTGSGDVNSRYFPTIEEGLEHAGFTITTKAWLDEYDALLAEKQKEFEHEQQEKVKKSGSWLSAFGAILTEPEYDFPTDGAGDTAVYVLSRICGEGTDRTMTKGDFLLTDTEKRDILACSRRYENFVLVLNVGGVVDLTPVMGVQNILLLSQTGCTVGDSLADVLLGKAFPSGHLADTWSRYEDYPDIGNFGEKDDTLYKEGVYVGYRWFDTTGRKPLFPFGFGLSYTSFSLDTVDVGCADSKVSVTTRVRNTGRRAGKEVVQLYVSVPSGRLDQPYQVLAAFTKTAKLLPEEEEDVTTSFDMAQLASYDASRGARILEAGEYILRIGTNSRDTNVVGVVNLTGEVLVEKVTPLTHQPEFTDWKPEAGNNWRQREEIPDSAVQLEISPAAFTEICHDFPDVVITEEERKRVSALSDEQLARLCTGAFTRDSGTGTVGNAGVHVCGAAGESMPVPGDTSGRRLIMADGPAGLRLAARVGKHADGSLFSLDPDIIEGIAPILPEPMRSQCLKNQQARRNYTGEVRTQYCTAIPIGSALAQSFSPVAARMAGSLVGAEMEHFHVNLWLAPAMNLHRNPLCGRNFEYYSEDPLVSGVMAASITQGVQEHQGCGVTIKHFCCNNQETNRMNSNSQVSERALRDLYLRGFEIAVRTAQPAAVMTSYNLLNGQHTSMTRELLEGILRGEWGFAGLVMSDWVVAREARTDQKWPGAIPSGAIAAGNDLFMPGMQEDVDEILSDLQGDGEDGHMRRRQLEISAARVIRAIRRLN